MKTIPATEAKTNFGALLDAAQRSPVMIEKKGRPVAVMVSYEEYQMQQHLKLEALREDLRLGVEQADKGELINGDDVFRDFI